MNGPAVNSLPGPEDILRQELPNGAVLLGRANYNSPSVFIQGHLPAGALFDPPERLGLADFTAAALLHGVQQRDFHEIYDLLESAGASLSFVSGVHSVSFSGKALVEDLDLLLGLLFEALTGPVFPDEHVERLRAQLLTALAMRAQDTGEMASLTFDQIVYRQHPYRLPEDGYPETVQAIRRENLVEFHRRHYGPRGLHLAIVGGIDPRLALEKAAAALDGWINPEQPASPALPPLQPLLASERQHVAIPGKFQTDLVIGAAGPLRRDPDYLAASLGNHILGQFGMMGRIGEAVREQAGLAYYASSSLGGGMGPGPWDIAAGVDPENLERAIELILEEVRRFTQEPVSAMELADSQANYIGRLPLSLESNAGVASALLTLERYQLGLDYYRRYAGLVRAVTAGRILETARRFLDPQRLAIVSAGP